MTAGRGSLIAGLVIAFAVRLWAFNWRSAQMDALPLLDGRYFGYTADEARDLLTMRSPAIYATAAVAAAAGPGRRGSHKGAMVIFLRRLKPEATPRRS